MSKLEAIEKASIDELRSLQLTRLKWSIGHTYENVAPYRAKCEKVGVNPADLNILEDLARFPFTVKDDLRQSYPFGMFAVPQKEVVRIHASSGTTGKPTVVGYTRNDIDMWATVVARSISLRVYPTLFSVSAAFLVTIVVSMTDRSDRASIDRAGYGEQLVRSEIGEQTGSD